MRPYALGIDVGTTKVAAVVLDAQGELMASASGEHCADVSSEPGHAEQDVRDLMDATRQVLLALNENVRAQIGALGVTYQMHGVVVLDKDNSPLTPLITWQDKRCGPDFLEAMQGRTARQLRSGYGCATLAWLTANEKLPSETASACTIGDFLVSRLCRRRAVTDPTGAASWGLFDLVACQWDWAAVKSAGIDRGLLPKVVPCTQRAGVVCEEAAKAFGIPSGAVVAAAIGDNQAAILASLKEPESDIALTLGTGGQVSVVLARGQQADIPEGMSKCEYRPFPGEKVVLVGASLCGGSAWAWLVETVEKWLSDLGIERPSRSELFERLNELGMSSSDTLSVKPNFAGERFEPSLRGSISRLDMQNFQLGNLARALARGIVKNLKDMLPPSVLTSRRRVVGSGNALRRNPLLQHMVTEVFNLPLALTPGQEESARGAAMNALTLL